LLGNNVRNFQNGLLGSPKCKGCDKECKIVYDSHHDQYFSLTCDMVVMEMGQFVVPYFDDLDRLFQLYEERWAKKRERDAEKERKRLKG
jgi:hypothetical protein